MSYEIEHHAIAGADYGFLGGGQGRGEGGGEGRGEGCWGWGFLQGGWG